MQKYFNFIHRVLGETVAGRPVSCKLFTPADLTRHDCIAAYCVHQKMAKAAGEPGIPARGNSWGEILLHLVFVTVVSCIIVSPGRAVGCSSQLANA